jgi:hypothetical protein
VMTIPPEQRNCLTAYIRSRGGWWNPFGTTRR